ncbi:MAG: ABC transporter permease [Flavobacteriales bacterium]|nr:ABC transporter permease [Flavobacteriales bacterium]
MHAARPSDLEEWDVIIRPDGPWWRLDLKELWHYRDLLVLLVKRDITAQYKQTLLGPLWHVVQPLTTTFTFALIFGKAAGLAPPGIPSVLFYMSGIVAWNFFAGVVTRTSKTFTGNTQLMSKVYFPRLVVPMSMTASTLVGYGIQLATLIVFMLIYVLRGMPWQPGPELAALPLLVLIMALLGLGTGILVSAMTTKYRDLGFLVGFGVQLLMYASPVIFPLSRLQNYPVLLRVFELNPMTPVIEATRVVFFGGALPWAGLAYATGAALVISLLGLVFFHRVERSFADIV